MLIIGRITKDAVVKQLKDDRQVVEFSVAVNDYVKPKNGEAKTFTLYVNCAYWISTKISTALLKGTLVEINGRVHVNAYTDMKGEPRASMNCHVNNIKIYGSGMKAADKPAEKIAVTTEAIDDLPF